MPLITDQALEHDELTLTVNVKDNHQYKTTLGVFETFTHVAIWRHKVIEL